jgi:hypothetical protein
MTEDEIREVCVFPYQYLRAHGASGKPHPPINHITLTQRHIITGIALRQHSHAQVENHDLLRHHRGEPPGRIALGSPRRKRPPLLILISSRSFEGC